MGIPRSGAHPPSDCLVETLQSFTTPNREFSRAYTEKFQQLADAARAPVAEVRPATNRLRPGSLLLAAQGARRSQDADG